MDAQTASLLITAAVAVIALVGLVAVGVAVLPKLKGEKQGYPLEVEIERALLPYIYQGICGAYRESEKAVTELGTQIAGVDKKALADAVYKLLPDMIGTFPVGIVKTIITQERWEAMVQDSFDQFLMFYRKNQASYDAAFAEWKSTYETIGSAK